MTKSLSRRDALKHFSAAGAGALLPASLISQDAALRVAGKAVEIAITAVSTQTVRLTIAALENGKPLPLPSDGSLAPQSWPAPAARLTSLPRERSVRCGDLRVKLSPEPLTIRIETSAGRLVQQLQPDAQTGALAFLLGDKPVLGFGEGGPQFDRRGETYTNRNGQGGYRLRTHGGRVPIQWLIGTSGWALLIQHPLGSFDLTGQEGKLTPRVPDRPESSVAGALAGSEWGALPIDVFIVAAREPTQIMQRYAGFLWSGDVYTTWETLKVHVPIAVNTGLTGIPYWGTDIGGFVPTKEYTGELHVRWFQFGAFCPLFRAHGRTWHLRLPWGWNTGELGHNEISNYTGGAANPDLSELRNAEVEPICKKYLELRYRMMPYLYSAVRETHETGLPIMRALWLHYPDDATAVLRGDEYLWGRDVLVAPVVEKGATARNVYLPRGDWYDFWTEEKLAGGRAISKAVDLTTTPLYVRAGAILPLGPVKQYTSEKVDAPMTLVVYPGADGAFTLYEDDGATFNYQRGDWMKIQMAWNNVRRTLSLRLAPGSQMLSPLRREIEVRLVPEKTTRKVVFEGRPIEIKF